MQIDLNCDLGESFGSYRIGNDEAILPLVSSVNIACGYHAGDPSVMRKTVRQALDSHAAIGAHPGLPDLQGFGRRAWTLSPDEAYDIVLYQIGALDGFVRSEGGRMHHVKPHGALYNMAAADPFLAKAIAKAIYKYDASLILFGLSGSELLKAGKETGLKTASEVFADRTYQSSGALTPRTHPHALITDHGTAIEQVKKMILEQKTMSTDGQEIPITADTVCIHGDGAHALEFAEKIGRELQQSGIEIKSVE
ncbi:LamB/YcsF family protein [Bacillus sp. FJAT-42376]|uniref:LamB/YcsF family protein n=1 Tax=Bacillus sp. FJAT-42376 TaxID=2014076 RepID=UPI000F516DC8|nr:5-oxoprolinase subunit PxpA [Bacillus sp. FJAT-42376]AZB43929.1 LamB/YcsF family protein [Bacillus sp. FJAT-42376]